jgi:hypothetical protein
MARKSSILAAVRGMTSIDQPSIIPDISGSGVSAFGLLPKFRIDTARLR